MIGLWARNLMASDDGTGLTKGAPFTRVSCQLLCCASHAPNGQPESRDRIACAPYQITTRACKAARERQPDPLRATQALCRVPSTPGGCCKRCRHPWIPAAQLARARAAGAASAASAAASRRPAACYVLACAWPPALHSVCDVLHVTLPPMVCRQVAACHSLPPRCWLRHWPVGQESGAGPGLGPGLRPCPLQ